MDPTCLACSLSQLKAAETLSQIQYAVAAKLMRTQKQQGAAVAQLIAAANQQVESAAAAVAGDASSIHFYA